MKDLIIVSRQQHLGESNHQVSAGSQTPEKLTFVKYGCTVAIETVGSHISQPWEVTVSLIHPSTVSI